MTRLLGWLGIGLLWIPIVAGFWLEGFGNIQILTSRQLELLGASLFYSFLVGIACTALGFLIACQTSSLSPRLRRMLLILLTGSAALPSIVISTPSLILLLRLMPSYSQGLIPALLVQTLAFTPICALVAILAVSSLPKEQVNAAQLAPSPSIAMFKIIVPMLRPGLATAFGLASLMSLIDFTITSIFNWNTYSLEAFTDISAGQPVMGACVPLLILGIAGAIICGKWMCKLTWTEGRLSIHPLPMPSWLSWLSIGATLAVVVLILGMFFGLISSVESVQAARTSLENASSDAQSSLRINIATCAISLIWSVIIASLLVRSKSWLTWSLAIAPFSFLPTLVGIVFAQLGVRTGLAGVWLPALALSIRIVPVVSAVIAIGVGQIDRSVIEAARVSLGSFKRIACVYLPLALPALAMGVCLSFISGLGDVGTMLLVVQPGQSTLSLRLYNYLHYGSAPDSTVISFIIVCCAMALAWLFSAQKRQA